jgi:hypothetical protein
MTPILAPVEVKQVVRRALVDNDALYALVGDRVYSSFIEDPDCGTVGYPLVILEQVGGSMRYWGQLADVSLAVSVYSRESIADAFAIYDAVQKVLQMERLTVSGVASIVVCRETARPREGWNEPTRSHFVTARWLAQVIR